MSFVVVLRVLTVLTVADLLNYALVHRENVSFAISESLIV